MPTTKTSSDTIPDFGYYDYDDWVEEEEVDWVEEEEDDWVEEEEEDDDE